MIKLEIVVRTTCFNEWTSRDFLKSESTQVITLRTEFFSIINNSSVAEMSVRYRMWEYSSLRKPHFLPVQESVILIRYLTAGYVILCVYVILCGKGRQWRDDTSVNIPICQLVQGTESLSSTNKSKRRSHVWLRCINNLLRKNAPTPCSLNRETWALTP